MVVRRPAGGLRMPLAIVVSFLVFLAAVTRIPSLFPTAGDLLGSGAEVRSNNGLAYVLYLSLLPFLAILAARWIGRVGAPPWASLEDALRATPWRVIAAVAAAHLVLFGVLYAYRGRFVFSDGLYFQQLLHRMAQGDVPYRDFAYYYGPSMLYPAPWLTASLGLPAAYAIWFVATYLFGLVSLFVSAAWALGSRQLAAWWGVVLSVAFFNALTGLNLTFTRYLLPVACFVLAARYLSRGGAPWLLAAAAMFTFTLLYSSEVAALGLLGVVLLVVIPMLPVDAAGRALGRSFATTVGGTEPDRSAPSALTLVRRGALLALAGVGAATALLFALDGGGSAFAGYTLGTRAYLGGAFNVPFALHLTTVTLAGLTVLAAGLAFAHLASGGERGSSHVLAFALLALASQRGSFGSSDPDHIAFYALPTILLALLLTRALPWGARARTGIAVAVLVGLAMPLQATNGAQFLPYLGRTWSGSGGVDGSEAAPRSSSVQGSLTEIVGRLGTDRPYLMYDLGYYSLPVYESFGLRYGAYSTDVRATANGADVERAISEIRASGAYIVMWRTAYEGTAAEDPPSTFWEAFARVTGAHLPGSDLAILEGRSRSRLHAPLLEFVRAAYRPVHETGGLIGLAPK